MDPAEVLEAEGVVVVVAAVGERLRLMVVGTDEDDENTAAPGIPLDVVDTEELDEVDVWVEIETTDGDTPALIKLDIRPDASAGWSVRVVGGNVVGRTIIWVTVAVVPLEVVDEEEKPLPSSPVLGGTPIEVVLELDVIPP